MNYFNTDTEAIKYAIGIEEPFNYFPTDNGKKYKAINQQGNTIWTIQFINDVMGWQIGYYPKNLKINS